MAGLIRIVESTRDGLIHHDAYLCMLIVYRNIHHSNFLSKLEEPYSAKLRPCRLRKATEELNPDLEIHRKNRLQQAVPR